MNQDEELFSAELVERVTPVQPEPDLDIFLVLSCWRGTWVKVHKNHFGSIQDAKEYVSEMPVGHSPIWIFRLTSRKGD